MLTILSVLMSFLFAGLISAYAQHQQAKNQLLFDAQTLNEIIGNRSIAALTFGDEEQLEKNLSSFRFNKYFIKSCLYDTARNLVAHVSSDSTSQCAADYQFGVSNFNPQSFIIKTSIAHQSQNVGYLETHFSSQAVTDQLDNYLSTLLGWMFLILLLIGALMVVLLRSAMRPLARLTDQVASIRDLDGLHHISIDHKVKGEIKHLVDKFNVMVDIIKRENLKLIQSEARFKDLTRYSPIGIFQRDTFGDFIYVNPKWREITGIDCPLEEIKQRFESQIHSADFGLYFQNFINAKSGQAQSSAEYRLDFKNTPSKYLNEFLSPLQHETGEVKNLIGSLVDVTELRETQNKLEELAFYDALTRLPNRRMFADQVNGYLTAKPHRKSAVIFVDLDDFKNVNDLLGHDIGDIVLSKIAQNLVEDLNDEITISRMGGDEFNIFVPDVKSNYEVQCLCEKIISVVNKPIEVKANQIRVTSSIGVAIYPEDGESLNMLLKHADIALYESKNLGRNQYHFFSEELNQKLLKTIDIEAQIKHAIEQNRFELYFQPQVNLVNQKVYGAEVLLRWRSEQDGRLIFPSEFISIAEKTGLISKIDDYVIENVFILISEYSDLWQRNGIERIAINLSAKTVYSKDLIMRVSELIEKYQIVPSMIEFELTESMVIEDIERAIDTMKKLRELGVSLAIDDFGIGYSSLSYLKRFPIDKLKVDRSFVMDIPQDQNDMEIASAIIAMGHKLGLKVLAEGVENIEQQGFLVENDCDYVQGFFYEKAVCVEDFNQFIQNFTFNKSRLNKKQFESSNAWNIH